MTEPIQPALTAEEWKDHILNDPTRIQISTFGGRIGPPAQHAHAALCLYGQPFGFTREDVVALRDIARQIQDDDGFSGAWVTPHSGWADDALTRIADRINALLPPE